jgi:hypothetical protein
LGFLIAGHDGSDPCISFSLHYEYYRAKRKIGTESPVLTSWLEASTGDSITTSAAVNSGLEIGPACDGHVCVPGRFGDSALHEVCNLAGVIVRSERVLSDFSETASSDFSTFGTASSGLIASTEVKYLSPGVAPGLQKAGTSGGRGLSRTD